MDLYIRGAAILRLLAAKNGSLKALATSSPNSKRMYALLCQSLKYQDVLKQVICSSRLLEQEQRLSLEIALLLVHDLLLCKNGIAAGKGPFKDAVLRHKTRLKAEFARAKIRSRTVESKDLERKNHKVLPRWVRINTLKTTLHSALETCRNDYTEVENWSQLSPSSFCIDALIPNLLAFHSSCNLITHNLYTVGHIILQDKASCFPVHILNPPLGACVIDACAAPGNKTSYLAACVGKQGRVYAFERDNQRVQTLSTMMEKSGADCVHIQHLNFLKSNPCNFANVTHMLLDPSCSGSGIVNRLDYLVESQQQIDQDRLAKLAEFQVQIILHAMKFPSAKKISYSTCSIHPQENEHVVMRVLDKIQDWTLANQQDVLPSWETRGIAEECGGDKGLLLHFGIPLMIDLAHSLVRCNPGADGTIGFFAALFVRKSSNKRTLQDPPTSKKKKRK
ncbi:25S rRNA (cytosine-C(5))-methyltransferase rcm1 [Neolecta irregularis DAH-3]|uniref:25S rRNA (Cytosine-C(5))-methyltransferase rcm1 n=1 Tax=Neolecta irregularis (strain DAH-3) TaxID=1198029 RepID=A0A1U7LTP2_NEOID|nr:25S rRNA (cytosine-C(5))-methyltransferase rcm1 [Neolecta irregularis DAH-3]|eukprot:OLL25999.1 25S rRNA (cytosine-C(5))-methyltransferase rcm1 [Neolecta irregularis DAH-3]